MRGSLCALAAVLGTSLSPSLGLALDGEIRITSQGFSLHVPEDFVFSAQSLSSAASSQVSALQFHSFGRISHRPVPELGLQLGIDTGLIEIAWAESDTQVRIDTRPADTRIRETFLLGETYVELELGPSGILEIQMGKLRPRLGHGAIYDAYGLGVSADLDLTLLEDEVPFGLRFFVLLPDATFTDRAKQSPFVHAEFKVELPQQTKIFALLTVARDGDDGAVPAVTEALARGGLESIETARGQIIPNLPERIQPAANRSFTRLITRLNNISSRTPLYTISTDGWLGWAGLGAQLQTERLDLSAIGLFGFGTINVQVYPNPILEFIIQNELGNLAEELLLDQTRTGEIPVRSAFAELTATYKLTKDIDLRGFILGMTGDTGLSPNEDRARRFTSFVGIAPLITHTSLFFNGRLAPSFASPTSASSAPNGAGLLAGGVFVDGYISKLHVGGGLSLMSALVENPITNGQLYGLEANISADIIVGARYLIFTDLAAFLPMNYFENSNLGFQGILGLTLFL